jgi:protein required for attachment to host cells
MRNTERGHDWNRIYGSVETTDWHELEKEHFADRIATTINKAAESGEMKEIVLIAPPRVLGELRKQLSAKAQTKVRRCREIIESIWPGGFLAAMG